MAYLPDPNIFLVQDDDNGFTHFIKVCEPYDMSEYGVTGTIRRTGTIDCYLPSQDIGDQFIAAIKEDVDKLVESYQESDIEIYLTGGKTGLYEKTRFERR